MKYEYDMKHSLLHIYNVVNAWSNTGNSFV